MTRDLYGMVKVDVFKSLGQRKDVSAGLVDWRL